MSDIIPAIHALGKAQREIAATVKELKNSILTLSEKASDKDSMPREKASQKESATIAGKDPEKTPSFITQEDFIAMLEK
ncbi:hypothetical protein D8674_000182 [Pyrus ussuriensis x Pyrus communis]|uniref:Uncharacterized protein n=1 Tax=Pyrus ussuriensis x Pyrus communis TaxID=2448454 RepID=A0A5N5F7V5_9ROSA|nr:hypothetical protein D8674_000182 [Pyrus ussuriensis x Pyrus communis]